MKRRSSFESCLRKTDVQDPGAPRVDRISGSHHIYKKMGEATAISVPVHGNKSLKQGIQHALMKQAGLSAGDL
jgi:HicA toxin of bacterial toxin-antitoxin,